MTPSPHQALVVLGMHRSGTSALTRTLNLLGVELGNSFYQGPVNPKGYWEHEGLMRINDALVSHFVGHWTSPEDFPETWWHTGEVIPYRNRILEIVKQDLSEAPLWGMKDPRLCILLPLYLGIFDELRCEPMFVQCLRSPVEVSLSLERRDQTPAQFSLLLWLRYVLDAFYYSYPYRCAFIRYEALMSNWKSTVLSISSQLALTWPNSLEATRPQIEDFLTPSLRQFHSEALLLDGEGEVFDMINEAWAIFGSLTEQRSTASDVKDKLFSLRVRFNEALRSS